MSNVRLWAADWDRVFGLAGRHIDPAARRIETTETHTEIEPRVMAVLISLARRQGETVRRQDIIDDVWSGAPGADQSLSNAISLLRNALGDSNPEHRLIQTVPKQGYRLDALVEREDSNAQPPTPPATAKKPPQKTGGGNLRRGAIAGAIAATVLLSGLIILDRANQPDKAAGLSDISTIEPQSIAVLPFVNMSSDSANDYFSDGLSEEILNALAQIDSLKVAARTDSFRLGRENASIEEISNRLKVANVLEGSVRRENDQLRVTAQLISAADGRHLWSSTYDRSADDILAIQQDIALNIADALVDKLSDSERNLVAKLPTNNLEAYNHFLIGNHHMRQWTIDGNRRAVAEFRAAVDADPKFAEAHVAMGRAYYFAGTLYGWMTPAEAIPKVKASLVQGISSPKPVTRAEALAVYGDVLTWSDRDWRGALTAYQRAYEISGYPTLGYALTNSIVGNHDAAIGILSKRIDDGDIDIGTKNNLAWALFNARKFEDALHEAEAVIKLDENFADAYRVHGRVQLMMGNTDAAIASFSRGDELMNHAPLMQSDLAVAYARAGREKDARAILSALETREGYVPAPLIAQIYGNLGDRDKAFSWLEKGIEDGARGVLFLKINPLYDSMRDDPRFAEILERLNLAA